MKSVIGAFGFGAIGISMAIGLGFMARDWLPSPTKPEGFWFAVFQGWGVLLVVGLGLVVLVNAPEILGAILRHMLSGCGGRVSYDCG